MKLDNMINKPKMEECRVFYVNVGNLPPKDCAKVIRSQKETLSEYFDIRNIIFVPTRERDSGWQFPI